MTGALVAQGCLLAIFAVMVLVERAGRRRMEALCAEIHLYGVRDLEQGQAMSRLAIQLARATDELEVVAKAEVRALGARVAVLEGRR